jgi:hypothetical protein
MRNALFLLLLLTGFMACQKPIERNPALFGNWVGEKWLIFDKPSDLDAKKVNFEFKDDGTYTSKFGEQGDSGVWHTEEDKLYTKAEGKKEIMVRLITADGTHLNFEMNRGGQKETLELIKQ